MSKRRQPSTAGGNVQKNPSSKAAAILTRGAYMEYVSTVKERPAYAKPLRQAWNRWLVSRSFSEGWRLFSTFPDSKNVVFLYVPQTKKSKASLTIYGVFSQTSG